MSRTATFVQTGEFVPHTPVSNVAAGDVVEIAAGLVGIADRVIAAGKTGALHISGVYKFAAAGAISVGTKVALSSDGTIAGYVADGGSSSNSSNSSSAAANIVIGIALTAATSEGDLVDVIINK